MDSILGKIFGGRDRRGWPNCRFYNNCEPFLQSTIRPIYNLQSTIYRQDLANMYNFCSKPKNRLQNLARKKAVKTRIFNANLQSTDRLPPTLFLDWALDLWKNILQLNQQLYWATSQALLFWLGLKGKQGQKHWMVVFTISTTPT